jgi:hypothetical protein
VAEDLMPRLMLIFTTGGTLESHRANAEKLRRAADSMG